MIAGGRDPKLLHSNQYGLSADNGSRLLTIVTSCGRTENLKVRKVLQ